MKNIITIAKKELRSYFNNPTAYVVILAFLLLWEFLFFRSVFLIGEVSLSGLFEFLPWLFLIFLPALTMGSLAEEKSEGTLEFLLSRPVSQAELIIGKFLGILTFVALSLLFVWPLAWSFSYFGDLDWGKVVGQYLASLFLTMVFVSLGMFVSSFFASQISAFLVSVVASFLLIIAGTEFFSSRFPLEISAFLEQLSALNHFQSMARGVVDLRDVWYFVSLTAIFLGLAYLVLLKNKYGNKKSAYRQYQASLVILLGVFVLSNVVGNKIPGRLDLTEEKTYTLSPVTKNIVSNLPDIVNISFYVSDKLPAQFQPVLRETKDILEDYRKSSQGKIRLAYKNPSTDTKAAEEARSRGIRPVRFNVVSQEEFQVKDGYLGIAISYGGKDEIIPFIENTGNLEYQLSSLIRKLTVENKPKIGFISGHGEKNLYTYSYFGEELKKQFEVVDIAATSEDNEKKENKKETQKENNKETEVAKKIKIPEDVKTLVIAGTSENYSEDEKKSLTDFLNKGGNIFFLIDGVSISPQIFSASANQSNILDYIKEQTGISVQKNLVYDLNANESVSFGGNQVRYILPYPFWIRASRVENNLPLASKIDSVTLPWASSLDIDKQALSDKKWEVTELLATTSYAGVQSSSFDISPDHNFSSQDLGRKIVAVALARQGNEGRIVIVGDSDFLTDQNINNNPSNFIFGMETVSWLAQESALSQIKVKNLADRRFVFQDKTQPAIIKFGNMGFILASVSGYGFWRLFRRRRKKEKAYGD